MSNGEKRTVLVSDSWFTPNNGCIDTTCSYAGISSELEDPSAKFSKNSCSLILCDARSVLALSSGAFKGCISGFSIHRFSIDPFPSSSTFLRATEICLVFASNKAPEVEFWRATWPKSSRVDAISTRHSSNVRTGIACTFWRSCHRAALLLSFNVIPFFQVAGCPFTISRCSFSVSCYSACTLALASSNVRKGFGLKR